MPMNPGRRVAIDFGEKWVGLAISDSSGLIASPVATLASDKLFEKLHEISLEGPISVIYLGLPLHLSGEEGKSASAARSVATQIQNLSIAPVRLVDERLSTKTASMDKSLVAKYGIDAVAATEILKFALAGEKLQNRPFGKSIDD